MKRLQIIKIAAFLLLIFIQGVAAGQVKVSEKPVPPRVKMKMPPRPGTEYVLLPGRWVWHRPSKMYVWLGPVWVEPPKGRNWSPGYWQSVKDEWVWVPGKWERKKGLFMRKNKSLNL